MIGIIDYGMGNLFSVTKALERMEVPFFISGRPEELMQADGYILPGVGSFKDGMNELHEADLVSFIKNVVASGKPLLGICLGMQLLFDESEENGLTQGLALLRGRAVRFKGHTNMGKRYKVPHMGWNALVVHKPGSVLLKELPNPYVYFVHSYYIEGAADECLLATAEYDVTVPAVVGKERLFGTQFHPEKSGPAGLAILKHFIKVVEGVEPHESVYDLSSD